ncbi:hypothetical protein GS466_08990 [Rhodococcus hoagii]|nr:hypothetical protein [Prescottella equi]
MEQVDTAAAVNEGRSDAAHHAEVKSAMVVEQTVSTATADPAKDDRPIQVTSTNGDSSHSPAAVLTTDSKTSTAEGDEVLDTENSGPASAVDTDTEADRDDPVTAETAKNSASVQEVPTDDPAADSTGSSRAVDPSPETAEIVEANVADESKGHVEAVSPQIDPAPVVPAEEAEPHRAEKATPEFPTSDATVTEPEKLTLAQVDSFEAFLRFVREAEGALKPFELPWGSDARAALASVVDLDRFDDEIRGIAEDDLKLTTTLALLNTADRSELTGTPRQNATALAAQVLNRHPAFSADDVVEQRLAALVASEAAPETLSRLVTRIRNLLEKPFDGHDELKSPSARQSLQDNAVHSAILIAASAANWDAGACIDAIADNVWDAGTGFADIVAQREKLVALPKTTRKTLGLIVEVGRDRLRAVERERDAARTRIELTKAETQRLSEQLDAQALRVAELEAELESTRAEQLAEAAARRSERMGATTDFETLRVDLARTISKQVESLEDALDALEHGQAQITKEFVGRSVNTLRVSLSLLQPRTAHDSQGETA